MDAAERLERRLDHRDVGLEDLGPLEALLAVGLRVLEVVRVLREELVEGLAELGGDDVVAEGLDDRVQEALGVVVVVPGLAALPAAARTPRVREVGALLVLVAVVALAHRAPVDWKGLPR